MALKLHTAPTDPVITVAEAKLHLRVDGSDEDTLIEALIDAATLDAEHIMGRALMPQKWQLTLDAFEDSMDLQRAPVTAVDSVKYVAETDGVLTTLDPSGYQFASGSDYSARVLLAYGQTWPATREQAEAVQIVFSCGYADAASVPEPIKAWIKLRIGALYAFRESVGSSDTRSLGFADSLLDRYRTWAV